MENREPLDRATGYPLSIYKKMLDLRSRFDAAFAALSPAAKDAQMQEDGRPGRPLDQLHVKRQYELYKSHFGVRAAKKLGISKDEYLAHVDAFWDL